MDSRGARTVHFNAWEQDIASEPLLSLAAAIDDALPAAKEDEPSQAFVGRPGFQTIRTITEVIVQGQPLFLPFQRFFLESFAGVHV